MDEIKNTPTPESEEASAVTNIPAEELDAAVLAAACDPASDTPEIPTPCGGCGADGEKPCATCAGCGAAEEAPQEEAPDEPEPPKAPITVADIHFRDGGKVYFFDPGELKVAAGDHVIIDTARGAEYGICAAGNHTVRAGEVVQPLRKILRIATAQDERICEENRKKEKNAFDVCMRKIEEHKLDMQLVSAECAFDGSKILFFFTADGRVDFRELVKNLASVFRTRIELRQIGVRDKAKMVGGLGICGRPFCCKEFLDDFQPVSIKMAKTQSLSLNPTKISGTCGRLMCCLKYEQEAYEDLLKNSPKNESFVDTPDGRGTVTDVNLLRQSVRVRMEKAPDTFGNYKFTDIYVIRNGKAKKTDIPIPADFAPISSHPVRRRPEPAVVEEMPEVRLISDLPQEKPAAERRPAPAAEAEARPAGEGHRSRSRNRRRRPSGGNAENAARPQGGAPRAERPVDKKPAADRKPAAEAQGGDKKPKSAGRRRRPRRRSGGEGSAPTAQQS